MRAVRLWHARSNIKKYDKNLIIKNMKIKNDKQLNKLLKSKICIPIYYNEDPSDIGTIAEGIIRIDEDSMREEFENKLAEVINTISNY